jgi:hypothetical protein
MTISELRKICQQYNILQGKKKQQYVDNILKSVATVHSQSVALYQLKKLIDTQYIPDPAPIHNEYRDFSTW